MFPRNAVTDRKICIAEAKISSSCRFRFNSVEQKRFVAVLVLVFHLQLDLLMSLSLRVRTAFSLLMGL